jgi:hypothetical protein
MTLSDAPALRGFRLGMSPAEARAVSGNELKIKIKREGSFFGYFVRERPPGFLSDVRALYLRFFKPGFFKSKFFTSRRRKRMTNLPAQISAQSESAVRIMTRGETCCY